MMLRALYDLAHQEGLVEDPHFEPKPISFIVVVGEGGALRSIVSTLTPPSGKGAPVAKRLAVPRETTRTSKVVSQFLWDNAQYVFGINVDPKKERSERALALCRDAFRAKVEEMAAASGDAAARDVAAFLAGVAARPWSLEQLLAKTGQKSITSNAVFAFRHETDSEKLVSDRPGVRAWWAAKRTPAAGGEIQCLVTGRPAQPVDSHPKLKRLPGGQSSGVALVSFNNPAFESYGLSRNENAPIGRAAAEAVATALNRLLDRGYPSPSDGTPLPSRRFDLAEDTAVLFWSANAAAAVDLFTGGLDADPEKVRALYEAPQGGRPPALDDPSPFFALALSGEMARAKVRGWYETTLGKALTNVRAHFDDIDVARRGDEPMPLWRLLLSVAPLGDKKRLPPGLAASVFASIIDGRRYPRALLEGAVRRARVEREVTPERAALIKASLLRERRLSDPASPRTEVTPRMDAASLNVPYRLGRLFATLEKLQEEALPGTNATIRDRFFGAASATPITVFPRLIRGAQPHLAKVKRAVFFEKLIQEVLGPVTGFPSHLTLEEQGLFALGYYHQRQEFFVKKDDAVTIT